MITYSTEFPIDKKHSIEEVLDLAKEWILGSEYTKIKASNFDSLKIEGETKVKVGEEEIVFGKAHSEDLKIGGIRYSKIDKNNEWVTSIICCSYQNKSLLSIQVSCEAMNTATFMPSAKKPFFVRLALKRLVGGEDGSIPVTDKPFYFKENEIDIAARIINGEGENRLPIIYVSSTDNNKKIINPKRLTNLVSGMAHIFVEPSRKFSLELKEKVNSRNPYGGNVAVFWPESSARKLYFANGKDQSETSLIESQIAKDITVALSNRRPSSMCTWLHLKELISRAHYQSLKEQGSTELEEYVNAFDEDLEVKKELLQNAQAEIESLKLELRKAHFNHVQASTSGLIEPGIEKDFYPNEIKNVVIDALQDALPKFVDNSRQSHIIKDLLQHNLIENENSKNAAKIKSIFQNYSNMTPRIRSELSNMGFTITEDGKHYKAIYKNDGRYTFSISKTASDYRTGKNIAGDINKILYKNLG